MKLPVNVGGIYHYRLLDREGQIIPGSEGSQHNVVTLDGWWNFLETFLNGRYFFSNAHLIISTVEINENETEVLANISNRVVGSRIEFIINSHRHPLQRLGELVNFRFINRCRYL